MAEKLCEMAKNGEINRASFSGTTNHNGILNINNTGDIVILGVEVTSWSSGFTYCMPVTLNSTTKMTYLYFGNNAGAAVSDITVAGEYCYVRV